MINHLINELVNYGLKNGLIDLADEVYVTNSLLELFGLNDYVASEEDVEPRKLHLILEDMIAYAIANGVMKDDTIAQRDLRNRFWNDGYNYKSVKARERS